MLPLALLSCSLLAAADAPVREPALSPNSSFAVSGLNRDQLWNLRLQLEESKPGLGGPVALLGLGVGGLLLGGGGITAGVLAPANQNFKDTFYIAGGALVLIGAGLATWGGILLDQVFKQRRISSIKIEAVQQQLQILKKAGQSEPAPATPD